MSDYNYFVRLSEGALRTVLRRADIGAAVCHARFADQRPVRKEIFACISMASPAGRDAGLMGGR
jgi:hypothetical protein